MRKTSLKHFWLALLNHVVAGGLSLAVAAILFNSHIRVSSMNEASTTYTFDPLNTESVFEDTQIFHDILYTAVSDITKLAVFRGEMESSGDFNSTKKINVTRYAAKLDEKNDCPVTAYYELDNLINWGKGGLEYNSRSFSISDFVNYFGKVTGIENFGLNERGDLYFLGFDNEESASLGEWGQEETVTGTDRENAVVKEQEALAAKYETMSEDELEDLVYTYIMQQITTKQVGAFHEDDGLLVVHVPMLICRYDTADGRQQLTACADNWVDYMKLQENLRLTIENLTEHYQQYLNGIELYRGENSNLKYAVRIPKKSGGFATYTNVEGVEDFSDTELADYFSEFHRYLVYYPDTLEFTGNSGLTESDLYGFMNGEYSYAYPEDAHIWVGVDTAYEVEGDAFYEAHGVYEGIVPNSTKIVLLILALAIIWTSLGMYLTSVAGVTYDEEGERVCYLRLIDHIWTELLIAAGAGLVYVEIRGLQLLISVANVVYDARLESMGMKPDRLYEYGSYGLFGFLSSLAVCTLWFSFVRRLRCGSLWQGSFLRRMMVGGQKAVNFFFYHRNTAFSILVSYNLFLMVNLMGIFCCWLSREREDWVKALIILVVVAFDGIVGVVLFRHGAGQKDIVEGINRIRNGEVDYKVDLDTLSGVNREMADAVNNIGEGIRKAVSTSMKDEQMKSDLITNVSHDIKTPLTSIVNYVDLLGRLNIQEEPARSYIAVLDNKAQRLKQLTDDLVEASKISSGNIVLNRERLNLTELLNQSIGEFSERLEERGLQVVFEDDNVPAWIYADSRRMWRIVENLFFNICKYALENTRVYLEMTVAEGWITATFKNISERQMNMRGDELTERFIRGDSSRTTEGSGLGLFIAKSLTQAQDGSFEIQLDGDLFKVVLTFPEYTREMGDQS